MNAKTVGCIMAALFLFCGCVCTTRVDGQILEYQRQIDRLESQLRARDRAVDNAVRELESISARSSGMGADIDGIIRELDEYQRTVERLLSDYQRAAAQTESGAPGSL